MAAPFLIKNRYEIKSVLGRGGMGVVYHAFDTLMRRDVAVKTLRDIPSNVFIELFYRECSVLAAMVHPNVVEIFDMGEFEEEGVDKPYFVMPLLPGRTLYDLIYPAGIPISTNRCVDIISQACRGLQAAHDRGLLHRDIKPRNIFVMNDDAVKLIDFGVAHLMGNNSTGVRGTPQYMSPEQITFKPLSTRSDLFSIATVCYEALTAVHPFLRDPERRDSDVDIATAITAHVPPLAAELNPGVSKAVAQVIAKGMAKDPWARFESAAGFADALQKAMRNESITGASLATVRIRLERARRSFEERDYQFASEIVSELEAEGHSDPEIVRIRHQLDEAVQKERTSRLLESAQRCFDGEEYSLALRKLQEMLQLDAENGEALELKRKIEEVLTEQKVAELLKTAAEYLEQSAFTSARQAVQNALKLRPNDARARQFLNEVDYRQKEVLRQRQEQERLYQAAQAAWLGGKIEAAIESLENLTELTQRSSEARERINEYKEFYRRVRGEHNALKSSLDQAGKLLASGDLSGAQRICDRYLAKYPEHADFARLKQDVLRLRGERAVAFRRTISERVAAERKIEKQIEILEEAIRSAPSDDYFTTEIKRVREKQTEIANLAGRARDLEKQSAFLGAIQEWEKLRTLYPHYPELDARISNARSAWERQRAQAKSNWLKRIEHALKEEDHELADQLLSDADRDFPGDDELQKLRGRKDQQLELFDKVGTLLANSEEAVAQRRYQEAITAQSEATELSHGLQKLTRRVFASAIDQAGKAVKEDWRAADALIKSATRLDPALRIPHALSDEIRKREREEDIQRVLQDADAEAGLGRLDQALDHLKKALNKYQAEPRLRDRIRSVESAIAERRSREARENRLQKLKSLADELGRSQNPIRVKDFLVRSDSIAEGYFTDPEFSTILLDIAEQVSTYEKANSAFLDDDVKQCLAACERGLGRFPDRRLFLALKTRAEGRQAAKAAEYLERTEQKLTAERDLEKRVQILEEAAREYPEEAHFQEELALVRNEQNLVAAIADRAQKYERSGLTTEAQEQWNYLQTIYPLYPGLDEAIERCSEELRRRHESARNAYVSEVEEALQNRNYTLAAERLNKAQLDFPQDEKLSTLSEFLRERIDTRSRAQACRSAAREDLESSRFEPGQERLREALTLGKDEPDISEQVAQLLLEHSHRALAVDLNIAESMIAAARAAHPALAVPAELKASIAEGHRRRDFDACAESVRTLEKTGDIPGALEVVRGFLSTYKGDKQGEGLERRLTEQQEEAEERARRARHLEELRGFEDEAITVVQAENLLDLLKRTQQIAHKHARDEEITRVAGQVSGKISILADIRALLNQDRLEDAERLCLEGARQFPTYPAFSELKGRIEVRQGERAADYLREVEQRLSGERDFSKQAEILAAAVALYPNESYYDEELKLVRNKQALLDAEIARARDLESKELYEDALREWEILRSNYPWRPGLDDEFNRVGQKWERKRAEVKRDWVQRIDAALAQGDPEHTLNLVETALADLPEDANLLEFRRRASEAINQRSVAYDLFAQGENALANGEIRKGADCLIRAFRLVHTSDRLQSEIENLLLRYSEALVEENWRASQLLVATLTEVQPERDIPSGLLQSIRTHQAETEIQDALSAAATAESAGNLAEAKHALETVASRYPGEQRIREHLETLAARIREAEAKRDRADALRQLAQLRSQLGATKKKRRLAQLLSTVGSSKFIDSKDEAVGKAAAELLAEVSAKLEAIQSSPRLPSAPLAETLEEANPSPRRKLLTRRRLMVSLPVLLVLSAFTFWFARAPRARQVELSIVPDNVSVRVGQYSCDTPKCNLRLAPGRYEVQLTKNGYAPLAIPLTINSGASEGPRIVASLVQNAPVIEISGNVTEGDVYLDDAKVGSLKGAQFGIDTVEPGPHVIKIKSEEGEATIPVRVGDNAAPTITGPLFAKDLGVVAVMRGSGAGGLATSGRAAQPVYLDDKQVGLTASAPLRIPGLTESAHRVRVGDGSESLNFDLPQRATPALYAFLVGNLKVGTLVISANVNDAQIFVNEKRYAAAGNEGKLRLVLPAGSYSVRATRQGYTPSEAARVSVFSRSETALNLRLTPKPAVMEVRGAAPGTQIRVDGTQIGAVPKNRTFVKPLSSGDHIVTLSRDGFSPKAVNRRFLPGETTVLAGSDVELTSAAPDAVALETQDWTRVSGSRSISELQKFRQKYPAGPHAAVAGEKIQEIAWETLDKKSSSAVQAFLTTYPDAPHSMEARNLLGNLRQADEAHIEKTDWDATDQKSIPALERFLSKHPNAAQAQAAKQALIDLNQRKKAADLEQAEENAWAAVNLKDRRSIESYKSRFPSGKHFSQADAALRSIPSSDAASGDSAAVLATLQKFAASWNEKNPEAIVMLQPSLSKRTVRTSLDAVRSMQMTITAISAPQVSGDRATVVCRRKVAETFSDGTEKSSPETIVTFTLVKQGRTWVIESAKQ